MRRGDLYTVHSGSREEACQGTNTVLVAFLDKPPHARPVHCTLTKKACQGTTTVLVALHGHWRCEAIRTLVFSGQATSCGGETVHCTLASAWEEACQGTTTVLVALHGHWRCEATRTLVVPGQATSAGRPVHCTLGKKLAKEPPRFWSPCTATGRATRPELWWFLDKPPWRGDLYTVHLGGSLSRNRHGSGRLARPLAALGDQKPGGSWTSHLMRRGDLYTVHCLRLGRKLVKEPRRFWSPCTATGRARRPEPWWFLDKPPHAAGRPVHCTLASAREEACQGTTTVLVALHGHWPRNMTRTLVVPEQAAS